MATQGSALREGMVGMADKAESVIAWMMGAYELTWMKAQAHYRGAEEEAQGDARVVAGYGPWIVAQLGMDVQRWQRQTVPEVHELVARWESGSGSDGLNERRQAEDPDDEEDW